MNAGLWLGNKVHRIGQTRLHRALGPFDAQIAVDLRDTRAAAQMVRTLRPDVILNAAAMSGHETCANDPAQAVAVNVEAVRILSSAAEEIGSRFIHISTDAVFSGDRGWYLEDDAVDPFSVYGETKLAGESAVVESCGSALVLRTNFFGWSSTGRRSVLEFFVNSLRQGAEVKGYPDFIVTSLYAQSLMDTIWRLNALGATGLFHVASTDAMSKFEFGVSVARRFGLDERLISAASARTAGLATSRSRDLSLNTGALEAVLGRAPETQKEGIRKAHCGELSLGMALRNYEVRS
jgi:dTDP-4-dehydrorhamnose reductase